MSDIIELSIVMPCLNEAQTLAGCIAKAQEFLKTSQISGEVIVADNGSSDGSRDIAQNLGATIVLAETRGYGAALMAGFKASRGTFVIMGDSDGSYDFLNLMPFVAALRAGNDLVMGNRFAGDVAKHAMPHLHRYLGNPVLSFLGRLLFGSACRDFHCGLRGFNRQAILRLDLITPGMEFASEMIVKASLNKLRITEVPVFLAQDGRNTPSHLRTWRDGWRHLRFLLLYSPRWLFVYPGLALLVLGVFGMLVLAQGSLEIGNVGFDVHSMLLAGAAAISGVQITMFGILASQFAYSNGLMPTTPRFERLMNNLVLERLLIGAIVMIMGGLLGILSATSQWKDVHFGQLDYEIVMRMLIPSVTLIIVGLQVIFFAFFSSLLNLGREQWLARRGDKK